MTNADFRRALRDLGLSQARLARILGADKVTTNRWALGYVAVPRAVELLLGAWQAHPELMPLG